MIDCGFIQLSFKIEKTLNENNKILAAIDSTLPNLDEIKYDKVLNELHFDQLIYFSNRFRIHDNSWPVYVDYNIYDERSKIIERLQSALSSICFGYHALIKKGDVKCVTFYYPLITFSERLQQLNIIHFLKTEYLDGTIYFHMFFPILQYKTYSEVYDSIRLFFDNPSQNIASTNKCYNFGDYNEEDCGSVVCAIDSLFSLSSFIKKNFNIELNFADKESLFFSIIAAGRISGNIYRKNHFFENYQENIALDRTTLVAAIGSNKWKTTFDYKRYSRLAIKTLIHYSCMRDLLSLYLRLYDKQEKTSFDHTTLECLKNTLQPLLGKGFLNNKIIRQTLKKPFPHEVVSQYTSQIIIAWLKSQGL